MSSLATDIRIAEDTDAHAIAWMCLELSKQEQGSCLKLDKQGILKLALEVRAEIGSVEDGIYYLLADEDDGPVGCIKLQITDAPVPFSGKVCYVSRLFVKPEYRGGNIFVKLFDEAMRYAKQLRVDEVVLQCDEYRLAERYEALGFAATNIVMRAPLGKVSR